MPAGAAGLRQCLECMHARDARQNSAFAERGKCGRRDLRGTRRGKCVREHASEGSGESSERGGSRSCSSTRAVISCSLCSTHRLVNPSLIYLTSLFSILIKGVVQLAQALLHPPSSSRRHRVHTSFLCAPSPFSIALLQGVVGIKDASD